jgi:hypothetical protein
MYLSRLKVAFRMFGYVYMLLSDTTSGFCNKILNYIPTTAREGLAADCKRAGLKFERQTGGLSISSKLLSP